VVSKGDVGVPLLQLDLSLLPVALPIPCLIVVLPTLGLELLSESILLLSLLLLETPVEFRPGPVTVLLELGLPLSLPTFLDRLGPGLLLLHLSLGGLGVLLLGVEVGQ
jgi:hypothetical protein